MSVIALDFEDVDDVAIIEDAWARFNAMFLNYFPEFYATKQHSSTARVNT